MKLGFLWGNMRVSGRIWVCLIVLILNLSWANGYGLTAPAVAPSSPPLESQAQNLLINGDMDDPQHRFYWRPTNHYVAGMWFEWWVGSRVPEYIDGGIPYHNVCYPPPPRRHCYDYDLNYFNLSQGYIRWGGPYIAGIYQPVFDVTPCTLYKFTAYNRNDGSDYHPKVGIDTTGWQLPIPDWDNPPNNCPPTGRSKCPDPQLNSVDDFPSTMVWSPEFDHQAYKWAAGVVTAEAAATTISVWTYAAPEGSSPSLSTYWDAASLVQVPFPDQRLPAPNSSEASAFIQNLATRSVLDELTISWTTPEPASTQLWYDVVPFGEVPAPFDPQHVLTTPLDTTPKTRHTVVLEGLRTGDRVRFVALSRRSTGGQCVTESSGLSADSLQSFQMPTPDDRLRPDAWEATGFIQNLSTLALDTLYIYWETPEPASTQVWYNIYPASPPITSTFTVYLPHRTYLPLMALNMNYETDYELATPLSIMPKTYHYAAIEGVHAGDIVRFVVLSCHKVSALNPINNRCVVEISEPQSIKIPKVSVTRLYLPLTARNP